MSTVIGSIFALIAAVTLYGAFRHGQARNWQQVWVLTLGAGLPFAIASGWVFWNGLPANPNPVLDRFGPDWSCSHIPYVEVCVRRFR